MLILHSPHVILNFPFFLNLPMQNAVRANILNLINSETAEYVGKTHSMQYKNNYLFNEIIILNVKFTRL